MEVCFGLVAILYFWEQLYSWMKRPKVWGLRESSVCKEKFNVHAHRCTHRNIELQMQFCGKEIFCSWEPSLHKSGFIEPPFSHPLSCSVLALSSYNACHCVNCVISWACCDFRLLDSELQLRVACKLDARCELWTVPVGRLYLGHFLPLVLRPPPPLCPAAHSTQHTAHGTQHTPHHHATTITWLERVHTAHSTTVRRRFFQHSQEKVFSA